MSEIDNSFPSKDTKLFSVNYFKTSNSFMDIFVLWGTSSAPKKRNLVFRHCQIGMLGDWWAAWVRCWVETNTKQITRYLWTHMNNDTGLMIISTHNLF